MGSVPSAKKMEGDDNLRTLERLRGRLVAQRAASRLAKEEAEQMGNKLKELENKLREEINSRNRAEKKLNSLTKKLESLNLSYVSENSVNSENSIILVKSGMSSISSSSTASWATQKVLEAKQPKNQITNCATEESKTKSPTISQDLEDNASQITSSSQTHFSPADEDLISEGKSNFNDSLQSYHNPKEYLSSSSTSDQAHNDYVDNLRALVPVDLPKESQPSDMLNLKANVVDVLDALRHAREKLELSIEKRQMIEVGSK